MKSQCNDTNETVVMHKRIDRRGFVRTSLWAVAGLPVIALFSKSSLADDLKSQSTSSTGQAAKNPMNSVAIEIEASKLLPETNPLVVALKYTPDVSKATLRKATRSGVAAKDQFCHNCQLYKAGGVLKGTKEAVGKCQMIAGGFVKAEGWCNSWVKKS